MDRKFAFIDVFAGIGGFRRAFEAVGGTCVFSSEWDRFCCMTYQANFQIDHPVGGDIRDYTRDETGLSAIPSHDVLVAGFPCQPFSIAGIGARQRRGIPHGFECTTQGTLFFDLAKIIAYHQPAAFLLENVKHLLHHDGGNTFRIIREVLEKELGYTVRYQVIDSMHWVPQHRKRVFIAGFRRPVGFSFDQLDLPSPASHQTLSSVLHTAKDNDEVPYIKDGHVHAQYTLSAKSWAYVQRHHKRQQDGGNGFSYTVVSPHDAARTLVASYGRNPSAILIAQNGLPPRRLTPRECARLMGFPDDFIIPVSDTQAYKQFGNSVVVPTVTAVARIMQPYIEQST